MLILIIRIFNGNNHNNSKNKYFFFSGREAATWLERCSALRAARRPVLAAGRGGRKKAMTPYEYDYDHYYDSYYGFDKAYCDGLLLLCRGLCLRL